MAEIRGTSASETITGTEERDTIYGGGGRDTIYGLGGDDYIDPESEGWGGAMLYGGRGNDTYVVHHVFQRNLGISTDVVIEYAGEGFDTVKVLRSWVLGGDSEVEWIEPVNLTGTSIVYLHGSNVGQTIIGDARANEIYAFGGNDVVIGGAGGDTMHGGLGNDTYYVDNPGDHAIDRPGEGFDRVYSSVSYVLDGNTEIEWLETISENGTDPISLTGNAFAQTIRGNAGANALYGGDGHDTLFGMGGNDFLFGEGGADTLVGGAGDDTFYITDVLDTVVEESGGGNDRVSATASIFLTANAHVEVIEATNLSGTERLDLGGSDTDNRINGNNGMNFLYGKGGSDILHGYGGDDFLIGGETGKTDSDTMVGGTGNDTYYVFSSTDIVVEAAGEGIDRVSTKVSFTLDPRAEIESLEAGDSSATAALTLIGSDFGNSIVGNAGNNVINGRGGNDLLVGLGGADIFQFTTALGAGNVDRIEDFQVGTDKIALDDAIFPSFNPGSLDPAYFRVGTEAQDSDDRIIYNPQTGALLYDADGVGGQAGVQFATLQPGLSLTYNDFMVI